MYAIRSYYAVGRFFRRLGIFVTPEEVTQPTELAATVSGEKELSLPPAGLTAPFGWGFSRAVADPLTNIIHCALLRSPRSVAPEVAARRRSLADKLLRNNFV